MDSESFTSERFRVLRWLGRGATGDVYEALDQDHGALVAVKALRFMQPHAIARFKHEFRALQDLHHPNLVSFGELVEEQGRLLLTMELVRGGTFLDYVCPGTTSCDGNASTLTGNLSLTMSATPGGAERSFEEERLRHAVAELAEGLMALHAAGKVHRDVKPSNVLVTPEGRVVLLDFGLLIDADYGDTWSGPSIVGTPHYMAPEQAGGQPADAAADWYSVGVMLFEVLTGRLPHDGSIVQVLLEKQRTPAPAVLTVAPHAPVDLARLCDALLVLEPSRRPDGHRVLAVVRGTPGRSVPAASASLAPPFVGRAPELDTLHRALQASLAQREPHLVLISGESGVGKSTLVRMFSRALGPEHAVVFGRCFERESMAFKAVDGVFDSLARLLNKWDPTTAASVLPLHAALLAQAFPVFKRLRAFAEAPDVEGHLLGHRDQRARLFAAVRELFVRLSMRRHLVIAIDDMQWADDDSLALLADVLRSPQAPPLLLVATLRTGGRDTPGERCLRDLCLAVEDLEVRPLSDQESRVLVDTLLKSYDPRHTVNREALSREAGGHPLFLQELVRHAAGASSAVPARLDDAIWARVAALDPQARDLVECLAVATTPLHQETIARAVNLPSERFARQVAMLRAANLVRTAGPRPWDTIEPYHDRIRGTVVAHLDADRVRDVHRDLAVAIEASPYPGQESLLAHHWCQAGRTDLASRHAVAAADRAADALAFDSASQFYRMALELGHSDRAELLTRLAQVLSWDGRGAEAADAYLAAAELRTDEAEIFDLERRAGEELLLIGDLERGMQLVKRVTRSYGIRLARTPVGALLSLLLRRLVLRVRGLRFKERQASDVAPTELARLDLAVQITAGFSTVDLIRSADFHVRNLLRALRAGEPTRVARALTAEAASAAILGERGQRRARRLIATARAVLSRCPSDYVEAYMVATAGCLEYSAGNWRCGYDLANETIDRMRNVRAGAWERDINQFFAVHAAYQLGELALFSARVKEIVRDARERGDLFAVSTFGSGTCNMAWLVDGDVGAATERVTEAERVWSPRGYHLQHAYFTQARAHIGLYSGDVDSAYRRLSATWSALEHSMLMRIALLKVEMVHARGRIALVRARSPGPRTRCLREVSACVRRIARSGGAHAEPVARLLHGSLLAVQGDDARAAAILERAAKEFDRAEMAVFAAAARWRLGRLCQGAAGAALVQDAEDLVTARGAHDATRFLGMLAPVPDDA